MRVDLDVTEGVITTPSNRMKVRLEVFPRVTNGFTFALQACLVNLKLRSNVFI